MKKLSILSLLFILSSNAFCQTEFKEAYYVNISQDTIYGLIKDYDWNYNPTHFIFKLNAASEEEKIQPEQVLYFEILNSSKYKSSQVEIDVSDGRISRLTKEKSAQFETQHLFLRTLVEGKANLYKFENGSYVRYFFETKEKAVHQLVYRQYVNNDSKIIENNRFRQQLLLNLNCDKLKKQSFENLKYQQKPLVKLVEKYNSCFEDSPTQNFIKKNTEKSLFLSIRPGVQLSSLRNRSGNSIIKLDSEFSFRIGLEVEYIMPFYNRKWAIFFEPNYQYYSTSKKVEPFFLDRSIDVDYQSVLLNFGVRHYFFLNNESKIFLNAGFAQDIPFSSEIVGNTGVVLAIESATNFFTGAGFSFNDKMSIELRTHINRDVLVGFSTNSGDYTSFELVFGYRFL